MAGPARVAKPSSRDAANIARGSERCAKETERGVAAVRGECLGSVGSHRMVVSCSVRWQISHAVSPHGTQAARLDQQLPQVWGRGQYDRNSRRVWSRGDAMDSEAIREGIRLAGLRDRPSLLHCHLWRVNRSPNDRGLGPILGGAVGAGSFC
jgi:hypothetical protein